MSKFYKISEEELVRLLARSMKLACLENDGVDNWSYYGEGFKQDKEDWAKELGLPMFTVINGAVIEHHEYDYEDIAQKRIEKEFNLIIKENK